MCEYCGCQEIESIGELTREHDALVALVADVRSGLAGGRLDEVAATCRQMLRILGPHTQVEEEGLFPAMADEFPDHVLRLTVEHRQIHDVLGEATDGAPADPTWSHRLEETMAVLRDHILEEQDGVFPAALASLSTEQWEQVEHARSHAGSPLAGTGPRPH